MPAKVVLWNEIPNGGTPELKSAALKAFDQDRYFQFGGGLGDIINWASKSTIYEQLDDSGIDLPIFVTLISHNPDAWQIFGFHPNAHRLTILNIPWKQVQDCPDSSEFRLRFGLPALLPKPQVRLYGDGFRFYPAPEDLGVLETLKEPYVAFATTASQGLADRRNMPARIIEEACTAVLAEGLLPIFLGRNYNISGSKVLHDELPPPTQLRHRSLINALTVTGSTEVIRRAVVSVTCDSSMGCAAHAMSVPCFGIIQDNVWKSCNGPEVGHGEILDPRNYQCRFGAFTPDLLINFIRRHRR